MRGACCRAAGGSVLAGARLGWQMGGCTACRAPDESHPSQPN